MRYMTKAFRFLTSAAPFWSSRYEIASLVTRSVLMHTHFAFRMLNGFLFQFYFIFR